MTERYIAELGRVLSGRLLAIWDGTSGLPDVVAAAYRDRWLARAAGESPPPPDQSATPCIHVGTPVRGAEAPDLVRDWHRCDHPRRIELGIAAVVCGCRGCGPTCPGYETG